MYPQPAIASMTIPMICLQIEISAPWTVTLISAFSVCDFRMTMGQAQYVCWRVLMSAISFLGYVNCLSLLANKQSHYNFTKMFWLVSWVTRNRSDSLSIARQLMHMKNVSMLWRAYPRELFLRIRQNACNSFSYNIYGWFADSYTILAIDDGLKYTPPWPLGQKNTEIWVFFISSSLNTFCTPTSETRQGTPILFSSCLTPKFTRQLEAALKANDEVSIWCTSLSCLMILLSVLVYSIKKQFPLKHQQCGDTFMIIRSASPSKNTRQLQALYCGEETMCQLLERYSAPH